MENSFKKNPLQDFLLSSLNAVISTNESDDSITGHVINNLGYIYKFQLKTTLEYLRGQKPTKVHTFFHIPLTTEDI